MGSVVTGDSTEAGVISTTGCGRGCETRGGVIARRAYGLGAPPDPKLYSTAGSVVPAAAAVCRRVQLEVRPEYGKTVRGAGSPGSKGVDEAGSMIPTEPSPCCWRTSVAAAGASTEPLQPPVGKEKNEAKAVLTPIEKSPPRPMAVDGGDGSRHTSDRSPRTDREVVNRHTRCVCAKSRKSEEGKGSPPKTALSGRGTSPPKPTPGDNKERVRSPQAQMSKIPPSSTGVKLTDRLWSWSVRDSGTQDIKSAWKSSGAQCVSESRIARLINAMGRIEPFRCSWSSPAPTPS